MTTLAAPRGRAALLLAGFGAAVALRVSVAGPGVQQSPVAGLVFAGCLGAFALAAGTRVCLTARALGQGLAAAVLLCLPAALQARHLHDTVGFASWAVVVVVVATAEEVFLRGTLMDAVTDPRWAVGLAAVAFAALHVPLYGWGAVPLDLAVGVVLGMLRLHAGTAAAPAVAHAGADLVAWFLR